MPDDTHNPTQGRFDEYLTPEGRGAIEILRKYRHLGVKMVADNHFPNEEGLTWFVEWALTREAPAGAAQMLRQFVLAHVAPAS